MAVTLIAVSLVPADTARLVQAEAANVPSLVISQLKLTSSNGQFITLYNATDTSLDMSKYQLEYFNNYDLSKATSSRLIALTGTVPPHSYYMVNDSALLLCYQLTVDSQSLGFSTTAGLIQVLALQQTKPGGSILPTLQDFVGWSKTAASGAVTLPAGSSALLQRQPVDDDFDPAVSTAGSGSWQVVQPDSTNPCRLVTATGTVTTINPGMDQLLPASPPPVTILAAAAADGSVIAVPVLPASDIGLMAPVVNELLPNPLGSGTDDSEEYIELYNPNPGVFDLSGFSLQAGLHTAKTYRFPDGTMLPGGSFTAFYASETGLSLSNSGSQVKLFDPFGNSISATQPYGNAKDGQAWALAKGSWYWTMQPTPKAANVIHVPPAKKSAQKSTAKKAAAPKPAAGHPASKHPVTSLAGNLTELAAGSPVHPAVLALIPGLALLYGAYEYRADLANRIHRLRGDRRARRADRQASERR